MGLCPEATCLSASGPCERSVCGLLGADLAATCRAGGGLCRCWGSVDAVRVLSQDGKVVKPTIPGVRSHIGLGKGILSFPFSACEAPNIDAAVCVVRAHSWVMCRQVIAIDFEKSRTLGAPPS